MNLTALAPSFGADITGLDLSEGISDDHRAVLRQAFLESALLVFRGQSLTPERHIELASLFGPVLEERGTKVGYVSNVRPDGITPRGRLLFHSDLAFTPEPLPGLSLHALQVPPSGAPTVFVSAVRAAAALPLDLRARVEGRHAVNVYGFKLPYDRRMRERDLPPGSPVTVHRIIDAHPQTGEAVLMVNELHTDRIGGIPEHESETRLAELFAILYAPEHEYRHDWQVGDVLVWDNIALQHGRPAFPHTEPRTLQRVTIAKRGTYDLVPNVEQLLA
jgi:taurine dioxygenase